MEVGAALEVVVVHGLPLQFVGLATAEPAISATERRVEANFILTVLGGGMGVVDLRIW